VTGMERPRPLQNRVQPTGEIAALPVRGLFTGNRGILHRPDGTLGTARWRHPHWLICALSFRDRYHGPTPARGWTALFFLDEAVALAAGHRPCHECRRPAARAFRAAWEAAQGPLRGLPDIDPVLHKARVRRNRTQVRFRTDIRQLPPGTMILLDTGPALLLPDRLCPYAPAGYGLPQPRPGAGPVTVLTPAPTVAALAAGYCPVLHPTAG